MTPFQHLRWILVPSMLAAVSNVIFQSYALSEPPPLFLIIKYDGHHVSVYQWCSNSWQTATPVAYYFALSVILRLIFTYFACFPRAYGTSFSRFFTPSSSLISATCGAFANSHSSGVLSIVFRFNLRRFNCWYSALLPMRTIECQLGRLIPFSLLVIILWACIARFLALTAPVSVLHLYSAPLSMHLWNIDMVGRFPSSLPPIEQSVRLSASSCPLSWLHAIIIIILSHTLLSVCPHSFLLYLVHK